MDILAEKVRWGLVVRKVGSGVVDGASVPASGAPTSDGGAGAGRREGGTRSRRPPRNTAAGGQEVAGVLDTLLLQWQPAPGGLFHTSSYELAQFTLIMPFLKQEFYYGPLTNY